LKVNSLRENKITTLGTLTDIYISPEAVEDIKNWSSHISEPSGIYPEMLVGLGAGIDFDYYLDKDGVLRIVHRDYDLGITY